MKFKQLLKQLLLEENLKWPKRHTASKEQMINLIINYLKNNNEVFDDSDGGENIEYYLKNPKEAADVRDELEEKYGIKTIYADIEKGEFYLGYKNKKYNI